MKKYITIINKIMILVISVITSALIIETILITLLPDVEKKKNKTQFFVLLILIMGYFFIENEQKRPDKKPVKTVRYDNEFKEKRICNTYPVAVIKKDNEIICIKYNDESYDKKDIYSKLQFLKQIPGLIKDKNICECAYKNIKEIRFEKNDKYVEEINIFDRRYKVLKWVCADQLNITG